MSIRVYLKNNLILSGIKFDKIGEKIMYRIINEDNSLVKEYPAPEIYETLTDEEKKNIFTFKKEIEKITIAKGLGRVSVIISYDGSYREKEFIIKYSKGFTKEHYEKEIEKIDEHMLSFSKKNNLYDFYRDSYILLRD